jgi:hypothetical protein
VVVPTILGSPIHWNRSAPSSTPLFGDPSSDRKVPVLSTPPQMNERNWHVSHRFSMFHPRLPSQNNKELKNAPFPPCLPPLGHRNFPRRFIATRRAVRPTSAMNWESWPGGIGFGWESGFSNTLWLFNIAIEHGPFIVDFSIKMVIFHSYVSLPEGISNGFLNGLIGVNNYKSARSMSFFPLLYNGFQTPQTKLYVTLWLTNITLENHRF